LCTELCRLLLQRKATPLSGPSASASAVLLLLPPLPALAALPLLPVLPLLLARPIAEGGAHPMKEPPQCDCCLPCTG